jgi:phage major head subunit gpT-like protein
MASSQFCGVGDNVDFKTTTRYRLTGVGVLEEVGPTGEIKHTSLDEDGFPSRVKTHAKMVTLTRVMMINDDLGAFLQLPAILGRQAALALEYAVFRLLISNPSNFFSVGNKNLLSGAGSVLGIDGLTKARAAFRKQADKAGQPIMLRPSILLVPAALETYAEQLFTDTYVNETTSENAPKPASNPHKGKFRPVASPMLDANGFIPGGSDTAWYLFADPADVPAIRISYLRGQRRPVLQSAETDFATLGMQWRNVFDFGVDTEEPRAAQKNAGG